MILRKCDFKVWMKRIAHRMGLRLDVFFKLSWVFLKASRYTKHYFSQPPHMRLLNFGRLFAQKMSCLDNERVLRLTSGSSSGAIQRPLEMGSFENTAKHHWRCFEGHTQCLTTSRPRMKSRKQYANSSIFLNIQLDVTFVYGNHRQPRECVNRNLPAELFS